MSKSPPPLFCNCSKSHQLVLAETSYALLTLGSCSALAPAVPGTGQVLWLRPWWQEGGQCCWLQQLKGVVWLLVRVDKPTPLHCASVSPYVLPAVAKDLLHRDAFPCLSVASRNLMMNKQAAPMASALRSTNLCSSLPCTTASQGWRQVYWRSRVTQHLR
jgi:hypothetical protein